MADEELLAGGNRGGGGAGGAGRDGAVGVRVVMVRAVVWTRSGLSGTRKGGF